MERLTIDEVKQIELELMDELDAMCKAHGIPCFIAYGTLLGAVRHGGFIPWDDDMDVVMMRDGYEQLIAHFDEWKSSDRFALELYRNGTSIYQFAKIVDSTTVMYENFVGKRAATGVWVDIFPLDEYDPVDKRALKRNARVGLLRSFVVTDPATGSNGLVKLAKRIVCPFVQRVDPVKLAQQLDENAQSMRGCGSGLVMDVLGEGVPSKAYPLRLFEPIEMRFEDRTYTAPAGYEELLGIMYGDWQTPPPEDQRFIHTMEAYRL